MGVKRLSVVCLHVVDGKLETNQIVLGSRNGGLHNSFLEYFVTGSILIC